jgi:hypothetical protein
MEQAKEKKRPIYTIMFFGLARPISMLDNPISGKELVVVPHMAAITGTYRYGTYTHVGLCGKHILRFGFLANYPTQSL